MEIFKLVFSPIEVNTYILADESNDCAIIDCGCYDRSEFEELVRFIETKSLIRSCLLNTHCHLDHVFGNGFVLEKYNLRPSGMQGRGNKQKKSSTACCLFWSFNE